MHWMNLRPRPLTCLTQEWAEKCGPTWDRPWELLTKVSARKHSWCTSQKTASHLGPAWAKHNGESKWAVLMGPTWGGHSYLIWTPHTNVGCITALVVVLMFHSDARGHRWGPMDSTNKQLRLFYSSTVNKGFGFQKMIYRHSGIHVQCFNKLKKNPGTKDRINVNESNCSPSFLFIPHLRAFLASIICKHNISMILTEIKTPFYTNRCWIGQNSSCQRRFLLLVQAKKKKGTLKYHWWLKQSRRSAAFSANEDLIWGVQR